MKKTSRFYRHSFIFILLFLTYSPIAHAATYYVATSGSDSNPGSEAQPFRTIAYAVNKMVAGDTTYVKGGTYNEKKIWFGKSGTQSARITLMNAPGEQPVIDFGVIEGAAPLSKQPVNRIELYAGKRVPIGYITIEGFEIGRGYNGIKFYDAHDVVIRRNWIHHTASQAILGNGINMVFDRNVINHNGNFVSCARGDSIGKNGKPGNVCNQVHGMYVTGSNYVITNNLIYDNSATGIQVAGYEHCPQGGCWGGYPGAPPKIFAGKEFGGADNWLIANNVFAYGSKYGPAIHLWQRTATNSKIINNIFYQTRGIMVNQFTGSGHVFNNNICYSTNGEYCINPDPGAKSKYTQSGNMENTNPNFESAGAAISGVPNFKLKTGSPAIDKGQSLSQVTWDHAGGKRPFGAAFDIGAYEFGAPPDSGSPPPNPTGGGGDFPPSGPPVLRGPNGEVCPSGF